MVTEGVWARANWCSLNLYEAGLSSGLTRLCWQALQRLERFASSALRSGRKSRILRVCRSSDCNRWLSVEISLKSSCTDGMQKERTGDEN